MAKTFFNISVCVESDADLDELRSDLKDRMEFFFDDLDLAVISCTWDRDQALAFVQGQNPPIEVLTTGNCPPDVAAVLAHYHLTLPKQRKPLHWKVPKGHCYGEVEGLPGLRGKVVLTDGIQAFLVRSDGKWAMIHWNWFILDDLDDLPEGIEKPKGRPGSKRDQVIDICFADF